MVFFLSKADSIELPVCPWNRAKGLPVYYVWYWVMSVRVLVNVGATAYTMHSGDGQTALHD